VIKQLAFFAISGLALTSCGKGAAEQPQAPDGPAKAFLGVWDGQYQKLDRENGITLSESIARAEFLVETETSGTFRMRFPTDENAETSGTYQVFKSESLLLKVIESNFSGIGLSGQVTSVKFEIAGNALVLENNRLKLLLLRDDNGVYESNPSGPGPADENKAPVVAGNWGCVDKVNATWNLRVKATDFQGVIVNSSGSSYELSGTVETLDPANEALLTITVSTLPAYVGRTLKVTVDGDSLAASLRAGAGEIDSFACSRK